AFGEMAASKRKVPTEVADRPEKPTSLLNAPTASELPVTRAMLGDVRNELLERIDETKTELRGEIHLVKTELRAEIHQVKTELQAEIHQVKAGLHTVQIGLNDVQGGLLAVQAGLHGVRGDMARIGFLVEEQNARNKVVLDALTAMMQRQDRVEQRMDKV